MVQHSAQYPAAIPSTRALLTPSLLLLLCQESRGNNASFPGGGHNAVSSTLHWGPTYGQDPFPLTFANTSLPSGQSFSDRFHTFGLKWGASGLYTYIDDDAHRLLEVDWSQQSFWDRGGWGARFSNPWEGRGNGAPFDQHFYLQMNVAVGGVTGFFPDGAGGKPWTNKAPDAANEFYAARGQWLPTWQYGTNAAALQVDWVKSQQRGRTQTDAHSACSMQHSTVELLSHL